MCVPAAVDVVDGQVFGGSAPWAGADPAIAIEYLVTEFLRPVQECSTDLLGISGSITTGGQV
jgi:hypothetical protein